MAQALPFECELPGSYDSALGLHTVVFIRRNSLSIRKNMSLQAYNLEAKMSSSIRHSHIEIPIL